MAEGQSNVASVRKPAVWVCAKHNRWVKIVKPEGDTLRPCPECGPMERVPTILSKRPLTGLTVCCRKAWGRADFDGSRPQGLCREERREIREGN